MPTFQEMLEAKRALREKENETPTITPKKVAKPTKKTKKLTHTAKIQAITYQPSSDELRTAWYLLTNKSCRETEAQIKIDLKTLLSSW
jgi:hypothetical protein